MNKIFIGGFAALFFTLSISIGSVGCGEHAARPEANEDVVVKEQSDGSHELQLTNSAGYGAQTPEGIPGEASDGDSLDKGNGCVYVQWCDEPGSNGTICRLYNGCTINDRTIQECIDDTYYVCGSPVMPWYIY